MSVDMSRVESAVRALGEERAVALGRAFIDALRDNMPRRTGELADSAAITDVSTSSEGTTVRVSVGTKYARYVNDGTGIYGPEGRPITPNRPGGVLAFDWPAAGGMVFAHSVRGSEPTHFMERTIEQWSNIVGSL